MTHKAARAYSRVFFASAHDEVPDKQGRVTIPAHLREYAGLDRDVVVIGASTRVEIWDRQAWETYLADERGRLRRHRGGGAARRTVRRGTGAATARTSTAVPRDLQPLPAPDAPSPVPGARRGSGIRRYGAMPERAAADGDLAVRRHVRRPTTERTTTDRTWRSGGRHGGAARHARAGAARALPRAARPRAGAAAGAPVHVDATLGLGGHAEAVLRAHPETRADRARPGHRGAGATPRHRLARFADRIHLVHAVYDELPRGAGPSSAIRGDRRRAVRPRGLVAAARRGRPRVRLRPGRAAGHADGPDPGRHRRGGRQHLRARRPGPGPAGVRRGEVRHPDRLGDRAGAGEGAGSPRRRGWPSWSGTRSRRRPGEPGDIRPSGRSRRCASRSTASWPRWRRRCRPRSTRWRRAGGWWCCPTTRWRTGSSSRPSPARARSTGPIDLPVELPGTGPTLRLLTRGAGAARRGRGGARTRGPPRCGCGRWNGSTRTRQATARAGRERPRQVRRRPPGTAGTRDTTHGGPRRTRPGAKQRGTGSTSERTNAPRSGGRTAQPRTTAGTSGAGRAAMPRPGAAPGGARRSDRAGRRAGPGCGPTAPGAPRCGRPSGTAASRLDVSAVPRRPRRGCGWRRRCRSAVPRAPFVALVIVLVVVAGVLGILVLNTKINENAFRLDELQQAADRARPAAAAAGDRSWPRRPARATWPRRPASSAWCRRARPRYIRLPDGRIIGVPQPADGQPAVTAQDAMSRRRRDRQRDRRQHADDAASSGTAARAGRERQPSTRDRTSTVPHGTARARGTAPARTAPRGRHAAGRRAGPGSRPQSPRPDEHRAGAPPRRGASRDVRRRPTSREPRRAASRHRRRPGVHPAAAPWPSADRRRGRPHRRPVPPGAAGARRRTRAAAARRAAETGAAGQGRRAEPAPEPPAPEPAGTARARRPGAPSSRRRGSRSGRTSRRGRERPRRSSGRRRAGRRRRRPPPSVSAAPYRAGRPPRTGNREPRAPAAAARRGRGQDARPARRPRPPSPPDRRSSANRSRRLRLGTVLALSLFAVIGVRLVVLQVAARRPTRRRQLREDRLSRVDLPAPRGSILDRNGAVLAHSVEARYVFADPALVKDPAGDGRRAVAAARRRRARSWCPS